MILAEIFLRGLASVYLVVAHMRVRRYLLRPCPGPTGYYTPVPGRRVGRTQMDESKTLGNGYSNVYGKTM